MNQLQIFNNTKFGQVRTIEDRGKILFCGSDVAKALGYARPNEAINAHCRSTVKRSIPHPQNQEKQIEVNFIPEGDVYRLAAKSELPGAVEFESWIFDEVLPSIRKTGTYIAPSVDSKMLYQIAQALEAKEKENQALLLETNAKTQIINELKPKADYTDAILRNKGLVTITQIAKDYGMSGQAMNDLLHELKIQYKQSEQWLLYREYQDKGYTHSETIPITRKNGFTDITMQTKWTQKGRLFIYGLLKGRGILPVIEKTA